MKKSPQELKIAFVYDRINTFGGAERVLLALHEIWPKAPLFTSVYNSETAPWAKKFKITTSFLQRIPFLRTKHRFLPNLMPMVFESFDFSSYDIVISITSAEAKGVITQAQTLHICYLLTPTRYLWSHAQFYLNDIKFSSLKIAKLFFLYLQSKLRIWDYIASARPDYIIPISKTVARRCQKYYKRIPLNVIYPPVETKFINPQIKKSENQSYYLVVSRLVSYKRVDLAIKACQKLGKQLIIIGDGPEKEKLESIAKEKIIFLSKVSENRLTELYLGAKAIIFPTEEDFGIVAVEAQAIGKPVIAYQRGGLSEIIQNHITGVFFSKQNVQSVKDAIVQLENLQINPEDCIQNALRFEKKRFQAEFKFQVEELWRNHLKINK